MHENSPKTGESDKTGVETLSSRSLKLPGMLLLNPVKISPVEPSSILQRVKDFLPQMAEANSKLETSPPQKQVVEIIPQYETDSDDDSETSDSETSSDEDISENSQDKSEKAAQQKLPHVEIDVAFVVDQTIQNDDSEDNLTSSGSETASNVSPKIEEVEK